MRHPKPVTLIAIFGILFVQAVHQTSAAEANEHSTSYNVLEFGIPNDGITLSTSAIQSVIDRASAEGGGIVYFPPGRYLTGTLFLKSHVTIHLEMGAVILGSLDIDDYVPVEEETLHHSALTKRHLIYGEGLDGVSIMGKGMIDGRGQAFWPEDFRTLSEIEIRAAMTRPDGFSTRPGGYVVIRNCRNVWIENIILRDSPHHMMKILESENVVIQGITIEQGIYEDDGPNTDGLAVSGRNIRISDCAFTTGDDCLVIGDTEHFVLSNCTFTTTESAIVMSGLKNGAISNCSILDAGGAFNIRPGRGGVVEHVTVSNINYRLERQLGGNLVFARSKPIEVRESVSSWAKRWGIDYQPSREPAPIIRNLIFSNITATADGAIFMDGLAEEWMSDITFSNIRFHMRGGFEKPDSAKPQHPFYIFGHHTAPYGIFCRFVKNVVFRDIQFTWEQPEKPDWGSAIRVHHGANVEITGFNGRHSKGSSKATIELRDVAGTFIRDCRAVDGTFDFLELQEGTSAVTVLGNDLSMATQPIRIGDRASMDEVVTFGNLE